MKSLTILLPFVGLQREHRDIIGGDQMADSPIPMHIILVNMYFVSQTIDVKF